MDLVMVILLLAMAAVVVVLALGIANFGKGGMEAAKRSNKMMRLRILFQFIAVLLIVLFVYLRGQGVQ
ncbi:MULTISPECIES: twin transmembrane helix small protein [unclassified Ruegeria]|uniref:twin transmembrane helix small protein n=1 Tax=unclassified Ruegeria TaxID=2625375 RepID=UPI0014920D76|nr:MULTISPECIES: twin transmembrane helix small protein [unclassified Ruegeria]NOC94022.1 twin transmembrane helix small protein [Ruegeria sp. HKCCD6604]UUV06693.1 twin transmembrane helix small protein [Ruegeria sp. YS9]